MLTIQELRRQTGMSQSEFSKVLKIPESTLKKWEQGQRKCPTYIIELIAYRVQHDELFAVGQSKNVPPTLDGPSARIEMLENFYRD